MQLIDNWQQVHKFWSARLAALTAFLASLQLVLPAILSALAENNFSDLLQAVTPLIANYVSPDVLTWLTIVTSTLTIVARITAQPSLTAKAEDGSK